MVELLFEYYRHIRFRNISFDGNSEICYTTMLLILVWSHANSYKTTEAAAAAAAAENDVDSCDHPEGKPVQCFVTVIIRVGIGIEVSLGAIDPHVACNIQIDWLIDNRLYSAILHSLEQTHCACMWFYMSILAFIVHFLNIDRSGVLRALPWLVPHETAAISVQVLCTPNNHAPCHFMQSHICKVYACLAVTCHLYFWQNDWDLMCYCSNTGLEWILK